MFNVEPKKQRMALTGVLAAYVVLQVLAANQGEPKEPVATEKINCVQEKRDERVTIGKRPVRITVETRDAISDLGLYKKMDETIARQENNQFTPLGEVLGFDVEDAKISLRPVHGLTGAGVEIDCRPVSRHRPETT